MSFPKIRARMLIAIAAIAANDDQRQAEAKPRLADAFAAAKVPATIEVYPERAWANLLALYKSALA
ncbi:MAG: hypothetical protein M3Z29_04925 [Pseudomonadota bacterium]|nr:hypothetical protein [Pseudomonadota bacterium]